MSNRASCDRCMFKPLCTSEEIKGCPCMNCLIKMMCEKVCENGGDYFYEVRRCNSEYVKAIEDSPYDLHTYK
jgi:hypothetical protein